MDRPVISSRSLGAASLWLGMIFWALAALTIGAVVYLTPAPSSLPDPAYRPPAPPPADMVPDVLPMEIAPIARDDARAANARIPFITRNLVPASPFRWSGSAADRARAQDCLAAAVLYEAGDDRTGQQAVAQVVLNRARHPAFPASVCGVVFQGSERRTGCQFTFTCDGALARRYSDAAWTRARDVADAALGGMVFAGVGLATHYHTDWVRPYWSDSLEKIAAVDTHLFFRWPGFWGTPPAFSGGGASEPVIAKMAALSPAHGAVATAPAPDLPVAFIAPLSESRSAAPAPSGGPGESIYVTLDRRAGAAAHVALALRLCGDRAYCRLMGWSNPMLKPEGGALNDMQREAMSFSYIRDEAAGLERTLWNCSEFPRDNVRECMKR